MEKRAFTVAAIQIMSARVWETGKSTQFALRMIGKTRGCLLKEAGCPQSF